MSGFGTLLHAQFHFRNQQAFQRLLASNSNASGTSDTSHSGGMSPRSFKSKQDREIDVNCRDNLGRSVLHLASASVDASSVEYVRLLLKHPGINVNLQDWESQWTALHRAMYVGNLGVVLLLLQHPDTDTTLKDLEGYTAYDLYNSTVEGTKPERSLIPATSTLSPIQTASRAELFTWGTNRNASLGHGDSSDRTFPDQVPVPRPVILNPQNMPVEERFAHIGVRQVRMGKLHTAVISNTSSTLLLCGFGSGGRLGITQHTQYALRPLSWTSAPQSQSIPSKASSAQLKVASVALGQDHTIAVTENGEVYTWGLNRFSQLGYNPDDGSAAAQVFSLDDPLDFIPQSSVNPNAAFLSNGEQIQLMPRRVYGPLKKEFVLGVAASKGASACWVRSDGSDGGNVYTWGLNNGQLGYNRTSIGPQIQVLPRKVTKITRPVVQIALGESAMACLLSGAGSVGGGWKGEVLVVWGDQVGRVSFPTVGFPSPITPYRPPQFNTKSARITKIVCSDDSPPPFSPGSLSSPSVTTSTPGASGSSHTSASNLAAMFKAQSASSATSHQNHISFACVSEGGEVFVFAVPGAPPIGSLGPNSDGDLHSEAGTNLALAKIIKPQRVWALKRGVVGAVRDVAIGVEGSLIVCTDSGHVYVRTRATTSDLTIGGGKSLSSGAKSQKFSQIPHLQRIVGVCASSTGAFGALRVDAEVKPIIRPAVDEEVLTKKGGRGLQKAIDALKGWDLVHDMKAITPWTWKKSVDSPLDRELLEDSRDGTMPSFISSDAGAAHVGTTEKHDEDADEDDSEIDIRKDIELVRDFCALVNQQSNDPSSTWGTKLPYGADIMVSVHPAAVLPSSKKANSKLRSSSLPPLSFPLHSVVLSARSSAMSTALLSPSESILELKGDRSPASSRILVSPYDTAPRSITFTDFHPLTALILMHYIYTDELVCIWDRRVCAGFSSQSSSSPIKITPTLGTQIKTELQTLAKILVLPAMLKAMDSIVKRPVAETLQKDLNSMWHFNNSGITLPSSSMLTPDIVLLLDGGREIFASSAILRARSVYFEDFLSEEAWTKERITDSKLKVDLRHMSMGVMVFVMKWLCCGQTEGLFGSLDFAQTTDAVLEFFFEVIAVANELLLFPLVFLTSQFILKFLTIHNACYILSEAAHYHAYELLSSVEGYISENLETFLETHMLDALSPSIVKHLSSFIRSRQTEKAPVVRSNKLVDYAINKWQVWLEGEDIPTVFISNLMRQRERKLSQTLKHSSLPPSHFANSSTGAHVEHSKVAQGSSSIIKPRAVVSPVLKPQTTIPESDDIFAMDEMEIGPSSIDPPSPSGVPAWKASSAPRVDMRSVIAEAAMASGSQSQIYTVPQVRGSPNEGTLSSSVRLRHTGSSQTRASAVFDTSSRPPSPSPAPRPSGSPWKTSITPGQSLTAAGTFPVLGSSPAPLLKSKDLPLSSTTRMSPQASTASSGIGPTLGPMFSPSRQPVVKSQPTVPRRVSNNNVKSTPKAWVSTPVHEPQLPTLSDNSGKTLSFVAIQQLQLEQGTSNIHDKRSLLEIQQEEQAKREEADFLKWWEAEEERVRLETKTVGNIRAGGDKQHVGNKNQQKKSQKGKGVGMPKTSKNTDDNKGPALLLDSSRPQGNPPRSGGRSNSGYKRGTRGNRGAPPASAS